MSFLIPPRISEPELLDEENAPRADVERSLRDLRRINRWLGGVHTYRSLLWRMVGRGEPVTVADLGAGTADLLDSLPKNVRTVALDTKLEHLLYRRNGSRAHRVVADAMHLPLRDAAVDVVTSAHFFHHFTPDQNASILNDSLRAARRGVVVNDTERHYVPLLFTKFVSMLRLVGRITRFDAPASVRRGYTAREAHAIGARTSASRLAVLSMPPYRFGLLLWK